MKFVSSIKIGSRSVGPDHPVFIIAEGGGSHFGKIKLAKQLIRAAAQAKADAFKLQIYNVNSLFGNRAEVWKKRLKPRSLRPDQIDELGKMTREFGMEFILTFHDEAYLHLIKKLNPSAIKIGSGEKNNPAFVNTLAGYGKPIILSTGMYNENDILEMQNAVIQAKNNQLALLHCNTSYPTPDCDVNIRAIKHLRKIHTGPVGYSDHTADNLALLGAVALGANIVEKHVTILRNVPNAQDWKVSCNPIQLKKLTQSIRRLEIQLGSEQKKQTPSESYALDWALKSLVAIKSLRKGCVLKKNVCQAKRPGGGIPPSRLPLWLGKKLINSKKTGETFYPEDFK